MGQSSSTATPESGRKVEIGTETTETETETETENVENEIDSFVNDAENANPMSVTKLLTLDGGGSRGILSAQSIVSLEGTTGLCGRALFDSFDCVVGTSTGGIIATALLLNYTGQQIVDIYMGFVDRVLQPSPVGSRLQCMDSRLHLSKYGGRSIANVIDELFAKRNATDLRMRDVPPSLHLISCVRLESGAFELRDIHRGNPIYRHVLLRDALRATAAAPWYFPPPVVCNAQHFDGGLVANNPTMYALRKYARIVNDASTLQLVLSVGTGAQRADPERDAEADDTCEVAPRAGILTNVKKIAWAGIERLTDRHAVHLAAVDHVRANHAAALYIRCEPALPDHLCQLDVTGDENLREMARTAHQFWNATVAQQYGPRLRALLNPNQAAE